MIINLKYLILVICIGFTSISTYSKDLESLKNDGVIVNYNKKLQRFGIGLETSSKEEITSFSNGDINRFSNDHKNITNLGRFIEIKSKFNNIDYYLIYGMLSELNPKVLDIGKVKKNDLLGKSGPSGKISKLFKKSDIAIALYTFEHHKKLEKALDSKAFKQSGVYWYDPTKIINQEELTTGKIESKKQESYNEERYKEIEFDLFLNFFNKTPGLSTYGNTFLKTIIDIQNMPIQIDQNDIETINKIYSYTNNINQNTKDLYKYKMTLSYASPASYAESCKITLYIQSSLVPFIMNEYKVGDMMNIDFLISYVNTFDQKTSVLVTAIAKP